MDDSGIAPFAGHLNPTAQEFRPRFLQHHHHHHPQPPQLTLFSPPQLPSLLLQPPSPPQQPQFYYPYAGGVSYHNYPSPSQLSAYVSNTLHLQQQQRPLNLVQTLPSPPTLQQPLVTASRSLLISSVPKLVSEATVRNELGVFGEIRAIQMDRVLNEGIVTVHFYDLRDAQIALKAIRERHMEEQSRLRKHYNETQIMAANYNLPPNCFDVVGYKPVAAAARGLICGEAMWAQFIVPMNCGSNISDGNNQGTIVIFNLDSSISSSYLKQIFDAFGPVRELRETPSKRHQKFVEFYDIRDAAKALHEMNGKELNGHIIIIEFSRPGGQSKRFFNSIGSTPQPIPPYKITEASSSYCTSQSSKKTKGKLEDAMASLCISDTGSVEGRIQNISLRKSSKKSNTYGNDNVKSQYKQSSKGKFKSYDSQFSINEDIISESNRKDSRTTVMIRNIPNKYSQKLILNMLDNHCIHCNEQQHSNGDDHVASAYDFLYLPIDFNNKCNVGYGFVNMTSPEATWRLYKAFHQQSWEVFNSRKICQVSYARVQGLEALKEHFKNSRFPNVTEEIFPVVFSPPRDGKCLSQPIPIPISGEPIVNPLYVEMDCSNWTTQKEEHGNEADDMGVSVA